MAFAQAKCFVQLCTHLIDSGTSSFLHMTEMRTLHSKFLHLEQFDLASFFLKSLQLFLIQLKIHLLYVSQMLLPLYKRVIPLNFLRMVVRKVSMFFCLVPSYPPRIKIQRNLIPFSQKSVRICCLFQEELSTLTGYGFCAKQLLHVNCEVLLCRCM